MTESEGGSRSFILIAVVAVVVAGLGLWALGGGGKPADPDAFRKGSDGKPAPEKVAPRPRPKPLVKQNMPSRDRDEPGGGPVRVDENNQPVVESGGGSPKPRTRLRTTPATNRR